MICSVYHKSDQELINKHSSLFRKCKKTELYLSMDNTILTQLTIDIRFINLQRE